MNDISQDEEQVVVDAADAGMVRVVVAFLVLGVATFGTIGFMYLSIADRLNGQDAWREKGVREQRDWFKAVCEKKYVDSAALQEWIRQKGLKPDPPLMVNVPCVQPDNDRLIKQKE